MVNNQRHLRVLQRSECGEVKKARRELCIGEIDSGVYLGGEGCGVFQLMRVGLQVKGQVVPAAGRRASWHQRLVAGHGPLPTPIPKDPSYFASAA